jgi:hypothetical protein
VIACNRAIEFVQADYWVWVDRIHFERSKWHPHARKACWVTPSNQPVERNAEIVLYEPERKLPCAPNQLYLSGGTLTVAAHLAIRLGAKEIVFVGCDAWNPQRDRYHSWDGAALTPEGLSEHENHLKRTAAGIQALAASYPDARFYDATEAERHLGLQSYSPSAAVPQATEPLDIPKRAERIEPQPKQDLNICSGYGKLVGVMSIGPTDAILWYEDLSGTTRALRVTLDLSNGLSLQQNGYAQICRT